MAKLTNYYFKKSIEKFGEEYIKELTKQLIKAKKKASGDLIRSLDYKLLETSNEITLRIIANAYLINVDEGTPKGKKVDPSALGKWAKIKRLPLTFRGIKYKNYEQVGWAIRGKIIKEGIKETNVLEKTRKSLFENKKVIDELSNGALLDLDRLIDETFKDLKNINIKTI